MSWPVVPQQFMASGPAGVKNCSRMTSHDSQPVVFQQAAVGLYLEVREMVQMSSQKSSLKIWEPRQHLGVLAPLPPP